MKLKDPSEEVDLSGLQAGIFWAVRILPKGKYKPERRVVHLIRISGRSPFFEMEPVLIFGKNSEERGFQIHPADLRAGRAVLGPRMEVPEASTIAPAPAVS